MSLIRFPFERVIEINAQILETGPGMKRSADVGKLQGALARVDNAIIFRDSMTYLRRGLSAVFSRACMVLHIVLRIELVPA